MKAQKLHDLIALAAPIHGVAVVDPTDARTWRVDFKDEATAQQRANAFSVLRSIIAGAPASRTATINRLLSVLSDDEHAKFRTGKPKDIDRLLTRTDPVPEDNPQIKRVSTLIGITPAQWFDRL